MKTGLTAAGALLLIIGGVWTGQGANLIGGSFMTGQTTWLVIGLIAMAIGTALVWWANFGYRRFP